MMSAWIYLFVLVQIIPVSGREFCLTETFSAQCPPGAVLLINSAHFGRMRIGRCMTRDFGHIGCSADVRAQLDAVCSGRPSCQLSVSDPSLVRTKPCPQDFSSYLAVSHSCIPVLQWSAAECVGGGESSSSSSWYELVAGGGLSSGAVSSFFSAPCPLYVHLHPGQRLNLTLLDFSSSSSSSSSSSVCEQYVLVEEPRVGGSVTLCGGGARTKHAYRSRTNLVQITIVHSTDAVFLLRYQVTGCSEPSILTESHVRYDGDDLYVFCNSSTQQQPSMLTCVDGQWTGTVKPCPAQGGSDASVVSPAGERDEGQAGYGGMPPLGISIVIILGVALVIVVYVAIMIVCVLFIRRRRQRRWSDGSSLHSAKNMMTGSTGDLGDHVHIPVNLKTPGGGGGHEERLPMLFTAANCVRGSPGGHEYGGDFCELHDVKSCSLLDAPTTTTTSSERSVIYDTTPRTTTSSKTAQIDRTRLYESSHTLRTSDLDHTDTTGFYSKSRPMDNGEGKQAKTVPLAPKRRTSSTNPDLLSTPTHRAITS